MSQLICHSIRSNKVELYTFKIFLKFHTGKATIKNFNTIDERRSKIIGNRVFDCHMLPDLSIAICHPTGNKWQSKTLFLAISICIKQHVFVLIKADSFPFL